MRARAAPSADPVLTTSRPAPTTKLTPLYLGGEFNLRFPGQYLDRETGLFYNYYRDYDPQTGRYVQSDPIGLDGGLNPYLYVSSNPLGAIDPFGLVDTVDSRITALAGQGRLAELRNLVEAGGLSETQQATVVGAISRLEQGVQGAKSAGELAKHVEKLQDARGAADKLQTLIREAAGKRSRDRLAKIVMIFLGRLEVTEKRYAKSGLMLPKAFARSQEVDQHAERPANPRRRPRVRQ